MTDHAERLPTVSDEVAVAIRKGGTPTPTPENIEHSAKVRARAAAVAAERAAAGPLETLGPALEIGARGDALFSAALEGNDFAAITAALDAMLRVVLVFLDVDPEVPAPVRERWHAEFWDTLTGEPAEGAGD